MRREPATAAKETDDDEEPVRYTVLSRRTIAVWAVLVVVAGIGMAVWLLLGYGDDDPRVQLDAIRTAGTLVIGAGGTAALLLAVRRQRSTEIALKQKDRDQRHQERVAAATEVDAVERRITELYAKAVEQVGAAQAPVRLGGMYALERLAQDNPGQRQTIVNVLCAYLRMPFTSPGEPPVEDADQAPRAAYTERTQEVVVRLAAQRILSAHLRPREDETFWPDIDIDLTSATLLDFSLRECKVRLAVFRRSTFSGPASFEETIFTDDAWFSEATFTRHALFSAARFYRLARFDSVRFLSDASFQVTIFESLAIFSSATFTANAKFENMTVANNIAFNGTTFSQGTPAEVAQFLPLKVRPPRTLAEEHPTSD